MKHRAMLLALAFLGGIAFFACEDMQPVGIDEDVTDGAGALALSGDTPCVGTLSGRTFDNVFVPVGKTCTLRNSTVKGNVKALQNSRLFMSNNRVGGNIDGVAALIVQVRGGTIEGSIQIKDSNSPSLIGAEVSGGTVLTQGNIQIQEMDTGGIVIADVRLLKGSIKVEDNRTRSRFEVIRNRVAQNVQVFKNLGPNRKFVRNNTIGQIVQCKENQAPFVGGPNTAGDAQDQCF
jgi:hypothetical protein